MKKRIFTKTIQNGLFWCLLLVSGLMNAQISETSSPAAAIPDNGDGNTPQTYASDVIAVAGIPASTITDISISLDIDHTWASDLDIVLEAPTGDRIVISADNGVLVTIAGSFGFSDAGAGTYGDPGPTYAPSNGGTVDFTDFATATSASFAALAAAIGDGANANGNWTLYVGDDAGGDTGTFNEWSLAIDYDPIVIGPGDPCELVCPDDIIVNLGGGECDPLINYAITSTGDCPMFGDVMNTIIVMDQNTNDGSFENQSWTSTSTNFGQAYCTVGLCGTGAGSINYGVAPNQGAVLLWFGGALAPEVGTAETTVLIDDALDGTASLTFAFENSVCGNAADGVVLEIDGNTVWSYNTDPVACDANGTIVDIVVDITGYADGGMHTITFTGTQTTGAVTNMTVDNVRIVVEQLVSGEEIVQLAGLPSGSNFPVGVTTNEFIAQADQETYECSFTVTVNPVANPILSLACNDHVNISVDTTCSLTLTTDMILEGGPYNCYDDYMVGVEGVGSALGAFEIPDAESYIGSVLTVSITDPTTGNNCWGTILLEDKIAPMIECVCPVGGSPITEVSGSLDADDPLFTRTSNFGTTPGNCNPNGTGTYFYDVFTFTVDIADTYTFDMPSIVGPDFFFIMYEGAFNPADPCDNAIAANDDSNGTEPSLTLALSPGISYTLVTTTFGTNSVAGAYTYSITSANGGSVLGLAEECIISCADADALIAGIIPADLAPNVTDNCGATVAIQSVDYNGEDCGDGRITVVYIATDNYGNSATCEQELIIAPLTLDDIECPENFEGECTDNIHPDYTGWPSLDGTELTSNNPICNIFVEYWDKPLTDCGGGQKIIRTFTILDWCTQEVKECVQIIKLADNEGPVMTCPDDFAVGTDFWYCYANVSVPKPTVFDACGSDYTLELSSTAGVIVGFGNNYVINELPIGTHTVTWTATDACDNSSTCSFEITVEDDVPPVPNCDEHTIVSLTNDGPYGVTLVPASVFDDGSYDNCSDVTFKARRMETCITFDWTTNGACIDDNPNGIYSRLTDGGMGLKPCVPFACCDVAQGPIMIELEVTDGSGNKNYCMVEIEVQDKLAPFIECPPDIIVSCDFWFDSDVVTGQRIPLSEDPMTPVFGTVIDAYDVHGDEGARQPVIINDPGRPTSGEYYLPQPYTWGIDGWADDNCDVNLDVRITILDDCSGDDLPSGHPTDAVRYIERRFTATDGQNNSDNCRQRIWVVDFDRFYIADQNCNNSDRNDGVIWPCDKTYTTCPDEVPVDEPTIFDDNCSLIGVTYNDTRFDFVDGACYKILREWTVIDWCQHDTQLGTGLWKYTQVIKVIDSDGPAFLDCPAGPVTLCAADEGVSLPDNNQVFLGEENPNSTYCSVHLEGSLTVEEFCSDYVIYDVKVYPFNGPDYIQLVNKTQVSTDENGQAVLPYNTRTAPVQAVRLNGLPYNSPFCGDYHRVLWSVEDGCGNANTCEFLLRLEDCKQPSPVCINGLSTVVMPVGGTVTIWAKEFDASSIDDCTKSENLLFSFSGDTYQPSMAYTCDNVAAFGAELSVQIWVADEGVDHNCNGQITWSERNKDYCTTTIVITDNDGVCGGSGSVIAGEVMTHADLQAVENTNILLTAPGNVFPTYVTVDDGQYSFIAPLGNDYTINADRNDDHKNGVSTLDLVRIQKHLLGVQPFDNPYDMIAADANNSESVSAIDLVELRKLILGIYTELPNNTSWRFVDAAYDFVDPSNPWPFDETAQVMNHQGNAMDNDFEAVKVGDVNNTVVSNATQVVIRNANGVFNLVTDDREVVAGETVEVTFSGAEFNTLVGYQFTMNTKGLEFNGVAGATTDVRSENIGVVDGKVTASWHNIGGVQVNADEALFTFEFVATANGTLSQMLDINSTVTEAEAYNKAEDIMDIALTFRGAGEADFALYQNEPNPFNGVTVVGFDLPEAGTATLTVFDVTGKVVKVVEDSFAKGYNRVEISSKGMSAAGVMYYRLDAGEYTATKKMVIVK